MDTLRFLDILGFVVGIIYLILEYKASIWLWLASIIMPAVDMFLYYKAGLYADFGMAIYYCIAAVYGFLSHRLKYRYEIVKTPEIDTGFRLVKYRKERLFGKDCRDLYPF